MILTTTRALSMLCVCTAALAMAAAPAARTEDDFKPAVIRFGATLGEMEKALAGSCKTLVTRRIDPPFLVLRDLKDKQFQIDCDGFEFLGKPRWAEFVVADDALEMVWILTDAADEGAIRARMVKAYGEPTLRNEKFVAFTSAHAALRTDRPEVLFHSERLTPRVAPWFGTPSTFR